MTVINQINDFLWGNIIAYILLGTGLIFTIRLGFPQVRYFRRGLQCMKKSMKGGEEKVSGFATLCAAVGGQVGTGSLVGVASAITAGGPGAIFWMWITALFGMVITFAETVLGQLFRTREDYGTYRGGAAYYIEKGFNSRLLAQIIAMLYVIGIGIFIASIQTNSIANAFTGVVAVNPLIPGIAVIALTGLVTVGGVKRLAEVSSLIVPFMALAYMLITVYIILINIAHVPEVFSTIIASAFTTRAAVGGLVGHSVMEAFRNGVARGLFSNDAGNGFVGTIHASAEVKHPVEQGLLAMLGTFITTIVICTCTALAIMLTGVLDTNAEGVNLLQEAFGVALGPVGRWVVFGAMFLFGFTTLLVDVFTGETNLFYIFREKAAVPTWIYRIVAVVVLVISSVTPLKDIWSMVDLLLAFVVFINVVALLGLFKYVKEIFVDYTSQLKRGIDEPEWDYGKDMIKVIKNSK